MRAPGRGVGVICPSCGNEAGDSARAIRGLMVCLSCRRTLAVNTATDTARIANAGDVPKGITDEEWKTLARQRRAPR